MNADLPPFITPRGTVTVVQVRRAGSLALELRGEHRLLRSMLPWWRPRTAATRVVVRPPQPIHDQVRLSAFYAEESLSWWIHHHTAPWPKPTEGLGVTAGRR